MAQFVLESSERTSVMKAFYGLLLFCLLFERAFVETRLIQKARTHHWDHRSCLKICGRPGTFPVECMEVCNSQHREDFASKVYTRTRKSVPIGQKKCPDYNRQGEDEKVIPKENMSANFTKDTNNSWIAIIQWKPLNDDVLKWEGYRVTYAELADDLKSKCILLMKNETQIIIHDKDNWNYPNGLTLVVSMYHSNSSVPKADGVPFLPEVTEITKPPIKKCPKYNSQSEQEKVIPDENISAKFTKDKTGSWTAVIHWKPINDVVKWEGYRVTYAELTNPPGVAKCVLLMKSQTKLIIHDKDSWNYPNGLTLVVSMYHSNSSLKDPDGVSFLPKVTANHYHAESSTTDAPSVISEKGYLAIILGILGGIVFVSLLICEYRRRNRKRRFSHPPDFQYDAFIIYSSHEDSFVNGVLLPLLEGEFNLTCCIHHRDFMPGESIHQNMADSVSNSRKIITVVSKQFMESKYCHCELQLALQRLLEWRDNSVLVIKVDNVDRKKLPLQLRGRTYIDYNDIVERCSWKSRLYKFFAVKNTSVTDGTETQTGGEIINNNNGESTLSDVNSHHQR